MSKNNILKKLNFQKQGGLLPVVVQDAETNVVLMVGFMNEEALQKTLQEGKVTYWSRTKKRLWTKGETSGHVQVVRSIWVDCDSDTLLIKVKQKGAVCHTGQKTCFFTNLYEQHKGQHE